MKKLSEEDRKFIQLLAIYRLSSRNIGEVFSVSHSTILKVVNPAYRRKEMKRNREYHRKYYSKGLRKVRGEKGFSFKRVVKFLRKLGKYLGLVN